MPQDLIAALRERLLPAWKSPPQQGQTPAGVLVPLVPTSQGWNVVLTRRAEDLSHHRGEISFPGGRADRGEDGRAAALREAHEELGIVPEHVDVLGGLPRVFTVVSGYLIEPWVGVIPRSEFVPNPAEIAEVLEVPLDVLRRPGTRREQRFIRGGGVFVNPAFDVGTNIIWGATARILDTLIDLLPAES